MLASLRALAPAAELCKEHFATIGNNTDHKDLHSSSTGLDPQSWLVLSSSVDPKELGTQPKQASQPEACCHKIEHTIDPGQWTSSKPPLESLVPENIHGAPKKFSSILFNTVIFVFGNQSSLTEIDPTEWNYSTRNNQQYLVDQQSIWYLPHSCGSHPSKYWLTSIWLDFSDQRELVLFISYHVGLPPCATVMLHYACHFLRLHPNTHW